MLANVGGGVRLGLRDELELKLGVRLELGLGSGL